MVTAENLNREFLALLHGRLIQRVDAVEQAGVNRDALVEIDQLTDDERRAYLAESIFLNQVKYENDKLESYLRKLGKSAQG